MDLQSIDFRGFQGPVPLVIVRRWGITSECTRGLVCGTTVPDRGPRIDLTSGGTMLISHARRFIYLKTLKTAGTSIEVYFERECVETYLGPRHETPEIITPQGIVGFRGTGALPPGTVWYNHMPASRVREIIGP